jgi:hypothetical protein
MVFCSEVPGLLHAGVAGQELLHHVQAQHIGRLGSTPPGHLTQVRSTRMLPSNPKSSWASSGGTRSSMSFSSSLRRCSASRGWMLDWGGLDLPGHRWAASRAGCGCAAPGPPVAAPALAGSRRSATVITHRVLAPPCGCGRRLLWPLFGVAATRPGTLLQSLFTSKCWFYACDQGHVDFVRIAWGKASRMGTDRAGRRWRRSGCWPTSCASGCSGSSRPAHAGSPGTRSPLRPDLPQVGRLPPRQAGRRRAAGSRDPRPGQPPPRPRPRPQAYQPRGRDDRQHARTALRRPQRAARRVRLRASPRCRPTRPARLPLPAAGRQRPELVCALTGDRPFR